MLGQRLKAADWRAIKTAGEVAKTVQLQRRQLIFWLAIIIFGGLLLFLALHGRDLLAQTPEIEEEIPGIAETAVQVSIDIEPDGRATINGQPTSRIFRPIGSIDELRYKIIDKPKTFIDQMIVQVHFATLLPETTTFRSFAVHGIDSAYEKRLDNHTLEYTAIGIGPEATFTIVAELPSGTIAWPVWRQATGWLAGLPIGVWLLAMILLPLSTLLVLLAMFWPALIERLRGPVQAELGRPPVALPPALAGVIVHGRITAREIAATLIDLANRGYIGIFNKGQGIFSVAKRRPWQDLRSFELQLLTQLFKNQTFRATGQDIELTVTRGGLFSQDIARVYVAIYDEAAASGYFHHHPAQIHAHYRAIGLFLFFIGLIAFGTVFILDIQPAFSLLFFAGMMIMALIIILVADNVPLLTPAGQALRRQWLAFQAYLRNPQPLGYVEGSQSFYEQYLAYAVVLQSEVKWAERFRDYPFRRPLWYDSVEDSLAIEDFANGLYRIVGAVADIFSAAKEPSVE